MSKTTNRMFFWAIVGIIIAGSIVVVVKGGSSSDGSDKSEPLSGDALELNTTVRDDDWTKGSDKNEVVLVEYSDFQCPACGQTAPVVRDLMDEFGNHITFVYRHNPLQSIHANAYDGARASEAAGIQGEFWAMHDKLFEEQGTWSDVSDPQELFVSYADDLGLDADQFETDYNSGAVEDAVDSDIEMGRTSGVNSTPSFFLNGTRLQPSGYEAFRAILREELSAK